MSKKNRKSKILLSTTLTASAFVSTMNVDAAQNTSADKWVKDEYCGLNEPAMRSFEPLFADNRASECGEKSHCLFRGTAIEMVFS